MTDNQRNSFAGSIFDNVEENRVSDEAYVAAVGPTLATYMRRAVRLMELLDRDHNQLVVASRDLVAWLDERFQAYNELQFSLQMTAENYFLNNHLIRLDRRQHQRLEGLKETFLGQQINQITFSRGVGAGEVHELLRAMSAVRSRELPSMEGFAQPNLTVKYSTDQADGREYRRDKHRQVVDAYGGLVVKSLLFFQGLRKGTVSSARFIKRMLQRIADGLDEHAHVYIGLIGLRLLPAQDYVHATHTAILSMVIAHQLDLDRRDVVRCGMTAITRDIHRIQQDVANEAEAMNEAKLTLGTEQHFQTNLTTVVQLSRMGASDLVSALRLITSYERGFPYNRALPEYWYKEELRPHLLSRIIELASHYDLWTQGMSGVEAKSPDLALQTLMMQMGSHYDPTLSKMFINLVGFYPVGSTVELSTGVQAFVIRSPTPDRDDRRSTAHRPVVRLMEGSGRIMDLSQEIHQTVRITRIVPPGEVRQTPNAFFLF